MKPAQNFKNHPKLVKGFHGLLSFCILALLGGSVSYFFLAEEGHALPGKSFFTDYFYFFSPGLVYQTVSAQGPRQGHKGRGKFKTLCAHRKITASRT
jgi:hypothetical protein